MTRHLRIACVQLEPFFKDPTASMRRADELLVSFVLSSSSKCWSPLSLLGPLQGRAGYSRFARAARDGVHRHVWLASSSANLFRMLKPLVHPLQATASSLERTSSPLQRMRRAGQLSSGRRRLVRPLAFFPTADLTARPASVQPAGFLATFSSACRPAPPPTDRSRRPKNFTTRSSSSRPPACSRTFTTNTTSSAGHPLSAQSTICGRPPVQDLRRWTCPSLRRRRTRRKGRPSASCPASAWI